MKSKDIIFNLIKYGDLLVGKSWGHRFVFGFVKLLNVALMHLPDALLIKRRLN